LVDRPALYKKVFVAFVSILYLPTHSRITLDNPERIVKGVVKREKVLFPRLREPLCSECAFWTDGELGNTQHQAERWARIVP
jgi:hypothetical protein